MWELLLFVGFGISLMWLGSMFMHFCQFELVD